MKKILSATLFTILISIPIFAQSDASITATLSSTTCPGTGCVELSLNGYGSGTFQVSGTFDATIIAEVTTNNTDYILTSFMNVSDFSIVDFINNNEGIFYFSAAGVRKFRIRVDTYISGNIGITIRASSGSAISNIVGIPATSSVNVNQGTSPWVVSGTANVSQVTSPWIISGNVGITSLVTTQTMGTLDHNNTPASPDVPPLLIGGYAFSTAPPAVAGDNYAVNAWFLPNGAQSIQPTFSGSIAVGGNGTTTSGTQRVTIASDSTLPNITIGVFPDNEPFNLNQIVGTTTAVNNGTVSAGTQRVTLASDSTGNIATIGTSITPGTAATNLGKAEDGGHTTGDVGVLALAVRKDTNSTLTSADGDYVQLSADNYGVQSVSGRHPNAINCTITSTATTSTVVTGCAAPGAGLSIYITAISWSSSIISTTTNFMTIQYGTGGTCGTGTTSVYQAFALAFTTVSFTIPTPIKIPANNEVCFVHPAAGTRKVNIVGFIAP